MVEAIAESILEIGQLTPIAVRRDNGRFVLIGGLQRLEACKALGEESICCVVVPAELAAHKDLLERELGDDAERNKMEKLRKLREQKEAAEKAKEATLRTRPIASVASKKQASPKMSERRSVQQPSTLSDWLDEQERRGTKY